MSNTKKGIHVTQSTLPTIYTLPEVAATLRLTERALKDWLAAHPYDAVGVPFYRKAGRTKLFTDGDIARLFNAFAAPCRPSFSRPAKTARKTTASAALTTKQNSIRLQELLTAKSPNRSAAASSARSRVAAHDVVKRP